MSDYSSEDSADDKHKKKGKGDKRPAVNVDQDMEDDPKASDNSDDSDDEKAKK